MESVRGLGVLGTRLGRRLVALFFFASFVPATLLAWASYSKVRAEIQATVERRLARSAKIAGLTTLGVLERRELTFHSALDLARTGANGERVIPEVIPGFTSIRTAAVTDGIPAFDRDSGYARVLDPREIAHLRRGKTLLVSFGTAPDAIVLMARAIDSGSVRRVAWGAMTPEGLWNSTAEALGAENHRLCVATADLARILSCEARPGLEALQSLAAVRQSGGSSTVGWASGDSTFLSAAWSAFLRFEYGGDDWRLIVTEYSGDAFAPLADFRRAFGLISALALLVVFALSHSQIRRSTEPLRRLTEGTRRIAAGDFSSTVGVRTDDEFKELADSFNTMTGAINRQVLSLRNLDALHQAVLASRDLRPLVETALSRFATEAPQADILLAAEADDSSRMDVTAMLGGVIAGVPREVCLSEAERLELHEQSLQFELSAPGDRSYVAGTGMRTQGRSAVAFPLRQNDRVLGVVVVSQSADAALSAEAVGAIRRLADRLSLGIVDVRQVRFLDALSNGTLTAFARTIDANSHWTAGHSERVTAVSLELGRRMGLSAEHLDTLERGGLLHDIGKIGVSSGILDKPSPLTGAERLEMERHPVLGARILEPISATFGDAIGIVRHHHEKMDGTGYPDRLRGEAIPLLARVLSVADVFDALVSDRPYRAGLPATEAATMIREKSRVHFDPAPVTAFLDALRDNAFQPIYASRGEAIALAEAVSGARRSPGRAA